LPIFPELLELAKKHNRTLLRAKKNTSIVINELVSFLSINLAPTITMHGVLIEVYGIGVLITGKSGIGKSETALDLIIRGHRLVADDSVEIRKDEDRLFGQCPELIRYFMEIRGIGIIDVERLYGVGAVKESEYIDLVVQLEFWDDKKVYDRLGLDEETTEILGVKVPRVVVPVKPGRNLAMIVELAARNNRQKRLGYNAAQVLNDKILKEIEVRKKDNERNP
jgi:HPr kinase/phosphorylase